MVTRNELARLREALESLGIRERQPSDMTPDERRARIAELLPRYLASRPGMQSTPRRERIDELLRKGGWIAPEASR